MKPEFAFIELILALGIGIMTVFLSKYVLTKYYLGKKYEADPYKNTSFMIFLSGSIFSVCFILFGIMEPLSSTIKLLSANGINFDFFVSIFKYTILFLAIGYVFSAGIIFISYKLFSILTKNLDEYEEISKNNIGVAILVSVLTIVIAMFTKMPFIIFIETLIPYPDVPNLM